MTCPTSFQKAWANVNLFNVILHGLAFTLIFTAFSTTSFTSKNVLLSMTEQTNGSFQGDAYLSSSMIYISMSCSNWIAPVVIAIIGVKLSLFVGSIPYGLYVASFIYPMEWSLYSTSVLIGIGAAVLWTAEGVLLTASSDHTTRTRNTAIFWLLMQSSLLFGNLIEFVLLHGETDFTSDTRILLFFVLTCICVTGTVSFLFIRKPPNLEETQSSGASRLKKTLHKVEVTFKLSLQLIKTKQIFFVALSYAYSGVQNTYRGGVFPSCVGQNLNFKDSKALIGAIGFTTGIAEVLGSVFMMTIGRKIVKFGRDPLIVTSFILHTTAYILSYLNLPDDCPIGETTGPSVFSERSVAILIAFLLGFGNALLINGTFSIIGHLYSGKLASSAFALCIFTQSLFSAIAFFYASILLQYQLLILVIANGISAAAYVGTEFNVLLKSAKNKGLDGTQNKNGANNGGEDYDDIEVDKGMPISKSAETFVSDNGPPDNSNWE